MDTLMQRYLQRVIVRAVPCTTIESTSACSGADLSEDEVRRMLESLETPDQWEAFGSLFARSAVTTLDVRHKLQTHKNLIACATGMLGVCQGAFPSKLKELRLSDNVKALEDPRACEMLGRLAARLVALEKLDIERTGITSPGLAAFAIGGLEERRQMREANQGIAFARLKIWHLGDNQLENLDGCQQFPCLAAQLPALEELGLRIAFLSPEAIVNFAEGALEEGRQMLEAGSGAPFPHLKTLVLSNNGMALDDVKAGATLGRLVAKLAALESLDLSDTGLTGESSVAFTDEVRGPGQAAPLLQLKTLDVMHNYEALQNAEAGGAFGRLVSRLPALETLNFSDTGLSDDALVALVDEVLRCEDAMLPRLEKLNLTDNFDVLDGEAACDALGLMVDRLPALGKLHLTGTSFKGRGAEASQSARELTKRLGNGLTWDDDGEVSTSAWDTAGEAEDEDDMVETEALL